MLNRLDRVRSSGCTKLSAAAGFSRKQRRNAIAVLSASVDARPHEAAISSSSSSRVENSATLFNRSVGRLEQDPLRSPIQGRTAARTPVRPGGIGCPARAVQEGEGDLVVVRDRQANRPQATWGEAPTARAATAGGAAHGRPLERDGQERSSLTQGSIQDGDHNCHENGDLPEYSMRRC